MNLWTPAHPRTAGMPASRNLSRDFRLGYFGPVFDPESTGGTGGGAAPNPPAAPPPATPDATPQGSTGNPLGAASQHGNPPARVQEPLISAEELQTLRTQLKTLQDAEDARQAAAMTEQQKLEQRATTAEQERDAARADLRTLRAERAIETEADALKLDRKLALALLPAAKLKFNDKGEPLGVKAALEALATEYPQLKTPAPSATSPTNPPRQPGSHQPKTLGAALAAHYQP
jgi:hypothetical protein